MLKVSREQEKSRAGSPGFFACLSNAVTSLVPCSQVLCAEIPHCNLRFQCGLLHPAPIPAIHRIRARLKTFLKVPLSAMNQDLTAGAHSEAPPLQPLRISLP